ncbi:hypothetical protein SAMN02745134_00871 [Clostridium acidisoli DSM 12555]|uniref:Deacetylase PdaC domain-containing protein n=1 Tax=Clostridium acidisoli DSM 12555 TaxID=1121291 RepID=A0A1W1X7V1_9CLOT|nr:hypothetical protein [Clostridium acidisoli]SMC19571.1 hypothetical protein SAMN02745134_00871 [Clostridium acidisoli DSM 12555]
MKKMVMLLLILVATFAAGCSKNVAKENTVNKTVYEKTNVSINSTENKVSNEDSQNYTINNSRYVDKNVKITYPVVSNVQDNNKQQNINNIIKTEALKIINIYGNDANLTITPTIKLKGKHILSIEYTGLEYTNGAAHTNSIFYTTNIDMTKGNKIILKDILNISEDLVTKVRYGQYKGDSETKTAAISEIKGKEDSDIINALNNADIIGDINSENVYSYFTGDSIGISIGVSHAIGDHAEFEVRYSDIKNILNPNSELSKYFY